MRWLLLIIGLLATAAIASAQQGTTAVTALVQDSQGNAYVNCQWSVVFVGQNPNPSGPYQPDAYTRGQQGTCDSFGNLGPVHLGDNINTMTPTPSQWQFNICSAGGYPAGPYCGPNILITITGASQNIGSILTPLLPILPPILSGGPNQQVLFGNATSVSLTPTHKSSSLTWSCWDNSSPVNAIYPQNVSVNQTTFAVTFTFAQPQSGYCVVNGTSGGSNVPSSLAVSNSGSFTGGSYLTYLSSTINGPPPFTGACCSAFPLNNVEAISGKITLPVGANLCSGCAANSFGAYATSAADSRLNHTSGPPGNNNFATLYYGQVQAVASNAAVGGTNPGCSDAPGTTNTYLDCEESDIGIFGSPYAAYNFQATLNGNGTPSASLTQAYTSANNMTGGGQYSSVFNSCSGCSNIALQVGATAASGTSVSSQQVQFVRFDSGGTFHADSDIHADSTGNILLDPASGSSTKTPAIILTNNSGNPSLTLTQQTSGFFYNFLVPAGTGSRNISVLDPGATATLGLTFNSTNGVYQTKRAVSGCTTSGGASAFTGPCTTTVTWNTSFANTNYTVSCTGNGIAAGVPLIQGLTAKNNGSITVQIQQATGVNAGFTTIECIATAD